VISLLYHALEPETINRRKTDWMSVTGEGVEALIFISNC
jgi:hypothetical protein